MANSRLPLRSRFATFRLGFVFSFRELGMLDPPVILGDIGSGTEV